MRITMLALVVACGSRSPARTSAPACFDAIAGDNSAARALECGD